MKATNLKEKTLTASMLSAGACAVLLAACGGGGDEVSDPKLAARLQAIDQTNCQAGAAGATSSSGVLPTYCPSFESDNPPLSCAQLFPGSKEVLSFLGAVPYIKYNDGSTTTDLAELPSWLGTTLNPVSPHDLAWTSTDTATVDYQVVGVVIKNASQTHIYNYSGGSPSADQQLDPPQTEAPILWYNVCFVEKPVVTGPPQWCSPGYWKNHTDAWPVPLGTPYDLSALTINRSPKSCASAPSNPTLYQVVSMPQCYGGEATNLVADLLSDEHPGVDYQGVRVENCPLN